MAEPALHREVLPEGWELVAQELAARGVLNGFYLAGGTGLALHLGHRRSVDLDFFTKSEFSAPQLVGRLAGVEGLKVRQTISGTVHLEVRSLLASFLHYPYPLLFPFLSFEPLRLADPRDIACMKLQAVASRGSRRDFVDVYVAAKAYGLGQILDWASEKYTATPVNRIHVLKSLVYFADAEREPMPDMLQPIDWATARKFFEAEVPRLM